jgi:hypothetical protein
LLLALSFLNFYGAFSPTGWSRRFFPIPVKSESLNKAVRLFFGFALLLGALLLVYGAFMPTQPED